MADKFIELPLYRSSESVVLNKEHIVSVVQVENLGFGPRCCVHDINGGRYEVRGFSTDIYKKLED